MGVMMQAFYWDCPAEAGLKSTWWDHVKDRIPALAAVGFTALWLPPASKAANIDGPSMGYDPYDYYDLGEFDQKGSTATWFGSREQLAALIKVAHENHMQVYADLVLNHNSGGDEQEVNPIDGVARWTKFAPLSRRFERDWRCFHPSPYATRDEDAFGGMPDLCHRNPYVYIQLLEYARWLIEDMGFDGFRYDFVKGFGPWMVRAIQELRGIRNGGSRRPYGVGEYWDDEGPILAWLNKVNAGSENPVGAFDFPLRAKLKSLCDAYGYDLRGLAAGGTLMEDRPADAVTFVENHDLAREGENPIINAKMMAYAFILTHEGYPCVFWEDYYNFGLAQDGDQSGIAALVRAHEDHAGGATSVLHVDNDLYIMQREGYADKAGLVFVLNNRGTWHGSGVPTKWPTTTFTPVAWRGESDTKAPSEVRTDGGGRAEFHAPPRGYTVYVPHA